MTRIENKKVEIADTFFGNTLLGRQFLKGYGNSINEYGG